MPSRLVVARIIRHTLVGVAFALLPTACGPAYQAPPVDARFKKLSPSPQSQLERGFIVHQEKCAKCHPFEDPAAYQPADLEFKIMPVMARKSKIDATDEKAVLAYLLAARQLPRPEQP